MRSKEEAHDYRYFPDPDLLPLELTQEFVDQLAADLPELPDAKKARFIDELGLKAYDASVLVADKAAADYFEAVAKGVDGKAAANWVINEVLGRLNQEGKSFADIAMDAEANNAILAMTADGTISGKIAKEVFDIVWTEGGNPREIVEARGLKQMSDTGELEALIDEIIAANPGQAEQVKTKPKTLGWFVGQVMQKTGGKANPGLANQLLKTKLGVEDG